jgi:hypothetical protein
MIGKIIMCKPTTTKVIMENLMIIKLIMAEPKYIYKLTMIKL